MKRLVFDSYGWMRPWAIMLLVFAGILGVTSVLVFGISLAERKSCYDTADRLGFNAQYSIWTRCIIDVDGQKIPLENYILNDER